MDDVCTYECDDANSCNKERYPNRHDVTTVVGYHVVICVVPEQYCQSTEYGQYVL